MSKRSEPWYIHAVLYVVIIVLAYLLVKVAIIDPNRVMEQERYFKAESRLRMSNIREIEKLYEEKHDQYTDDADTLLQFVKNDPFVDSVMAGYDTLTQRSTNPFKDLTHGAFTPESLFHAPKSGEPYIIAVDTTAEYDSVIDRRGRLVKVDTNITIGERYVIEDPDGYGTIGDLYSDAKQNTASWE